MLNKNSIWKVLLTIVIIGLCALYALPNIYGEDNAVQISAGRDGKVTEQMVSRVEKTLADNNITAKKIEFEGEQILVRLTSSDAQLRARELLEKELGTDWICVVVCTS